MPTRPGITRARNIYFRRRSASVFRRLTLRTELSLFLSSLLALSIGLAGGTAIYQSARAMRRELTTQQQLFAENRAFNSCARLNCLSGFAGVNG